MVRIRLRRQGLKRQPTYRVVVADQRSPRDGRIVENIGFFNPRTQPETIEINKERASYWLSVGAQPSEAVARLLKAVGVSASVASATSGTSAVTAPGVASGPKA